MDGNGLFGVKQSVRIDRVPFTLRKVGQAETLTLGIEAAIRGPLLARVDWIPSACQSRAAAARSMILFAEGVRMLGLEPSARGGCQGYVLREEADSLVVPYDASLPESLLLLDPPFTAAAFHGPHIDYEFAPGIRNAPAAEWLPSNGRVVVDIYNPYVIKPLAKTIMGTTSAYHLADEVEGALRMALWP